MRLTAVAAILAATPAFADPLLSGAVNPPMARSWAA